MRIGAALLAEFASVRNNQLTIVNSLDNVLFDSFPGRTRCYVALKMIVEEDDFDKKRNFEVRLVGPDGEKTANHLVGVRAGRPFHGGPEATLCMAIEFPMIVAKQPSDYHFEVIVDGRNIGIIPFRVIAAQS